MKASMKIGKDNLLMSTLVVVALVMPTLGPVLTDLHVQSVVTSAGRAVKAVQGVQGVATPTPTAMEPIQTREAAIIVTAPRLRNAA